MAAERVSSEKAITAEDEQELTVKLMRADIYNKKADTLLKTEQARWEP